MKISRPQINYDCSEDNQNTFLMHLGKMTKNKDIFKQPSVISHTLTHVFTGKASQGNTIEGLCDASWCLLKDL